jgi:hypothetical protein
VSHGLSNDVALPFTLSSSGTVGRSSELQNYRSPFLLPKITSHQHTLIDYLTNLTIFPKSILQTNPQPSNTNQQSWLKAKHPKPRSTTRERTTTSSSSLTTQKLQRSGRPIRPFLWHRLSARSRFSLLTSMLPLISTIPRLLLVKGPITTFLEGCRRSDTEFFRTIRPYADTCLYAGKEHKAI